VSYLTRVVGAKRAREMWMLARRYSARLKASFVEEFNHLLGQGDQLRRYLTGPEFWEEEQQEGARAFLEKRAPDFSRFRPSRA
jgi:2-ketocyclohexanecarboxyl-CoA hydrolase